MNVIYEGVDISSYVSVKNAELVDNAGGIADSIEVDFSDIDGKWSEWKPQKGHSIELIEDTFKTGTMFVNSLGQSRGIFRIKALSIPSDSKTENTKAWENVRFSNMASDLIGKYGFVLSTHNIQDNLYSRVDQVTASDFEFLSYRCMLEGYMLKLNDKRAVIYNESVIEKMPALITIDSTEFDGDFEFKNISLGLFNSCTLRSDSIKGIIKSSFAPSSAPAGAILKKNIIVGSQGEADRFTKGLLRASNKYETIGSMAIKFNPGIAAGTNVNITGVGLFDGKYFVDKVRHRISKDRTYIAIRKALEGY